MQRARTAPFLAVVVTALLLGTAAAQQGPRTGNVSGAAEEPIVAKLKECLVFETSAANVAGQGSRKTPLDAAGKAQVAGLLSQSLACLEQAKALFDTAITDETLQKSTDADAAGAKLLEALVRDTKAADKTAKDKKRGSVLKDLLEGGTAKVAALSALQGGPTAAKTVDANSPQKAGPDVPECAVVEAFEAARTRFGEPTDATGGAPGRGKKSSPRKDAKKPPPDFYLAFRATKGTAANGFCVFNLPRDIVGPYQARITAGSFTADQKRRAELGDAFACFEFDVKGSSPLEFLSVCARPTNGGVQVFASTRAGNLGQAFLADTDLAVLDVIYDGTTFSCRAKKPADDISAFAQFATFTRPQGTSTWTVGIGGAGLGGKAEVGVDDFAIWAIER